MTSPTSGAIKLAYESQEIKEIKGETKSNYKESTKVAVDRVIDVAGSVLTGAVTSYCPSGHFLGTVSPAMQKPCQDYSKEKAHQSIDTMFDPENIKWINSQISKVFSSACINNNSKEITNS